MNQYKRSVGAIRTFEMKKELKQIILSKTKVEYQVWPKNIIKEIENDTQFVGILYEPFDPCILNRPKIKLNSKKTKFFIKN